MNPVDFTPQWYRFQLQSARNRRRRLGALGVICLLMVCWFVINEGRIQSAQAALRETRATCDQSQLLSARLQELRQEKQELQAQQQRYLALQSNISPSVILAEISHRIPDEASVVDFLVEPIGAAKSHRPTRSRRSSTVEPLPEAVAQSCSLVVTLTAHAANSDVMYRLVQNLKASSLFMELHQGGIESYVVFGTTVKRKTIQLYVLNSESIGP